VWYAMGGQVCLGRLLSGYFRILRPIFALDLGFWAAISNWSIS
jgi:hypothetical protein